MPAVERHPLARWRQGRAYSRSEYSGARHPCGGRLFCPRHCGSEPSRVRSRATRFAFCEQADGSLLTVGASKNTRPRASILVPATPLLVVVFFVHVTADPSLVACVAMRPGSHARRRATPAREVAARQGIFAERICWCLPPLCGWRFLLLTYGAFYHALVLEGHRCGLAIHRMAKKLPWIINA